MPRLLLGQDSILDKEVLAARGFSLTEKAAHADYTIHFSTERYGVEHHARHGYQVPEDATPFPRNKSVMIQVEPPLAAYRQLVYGTDFLKQFHTAYVFNPDPNASNQFPVAQKPHLFPYYPAEKDRITREDTTLDIRKFYYAGSRYQQWGSPSAHGNVNLYPLRAQIVEHLMKEGHPFHVIGEGWAPRTSGGVEDWRALKMQEIEDNDVDFVFCLENSRYPNYVSEKIHDGFNSDRVVFYLGCPNIQDFVPANTFIDLSQPPYYKEVQNEQPYVFNFEGVLERIRNMTQTEYDEILGRARAFRDSTLTDDNYREQQVELTKHLAQRLLQTPEKS